MSMSMPISTWSVFALGFAIALMPSSGLVAQDGPSTPKPQTTSQSGELIVDGRTTHFSSLSELEEIVSRLRQASSAPGEHLPNYIELSTDDLSATKTFYESALGFQFIDYGDAYAASSFGSLAVGFAAKDKIEAPLLAIQSFDLETSLRRVREAGGEITKAIYAFPGGRRFQFRDPAGNLIAVFQNE